MHNDYTNNLQKKFGILHLYFRHHYSVFHLALSNMAQRHVASCERHVALHEHHVALHECHGALNVRHVALLISRQ